jgi:hypothetical protein
MGMYCFLRSATVEELDALVANPEYLTVFFETAEIADVLPEPTLWQLLTGKRPHVPEVFLIESESLTAELDKAWGGLHFLFTGQANEAPGPAGYLFSGGAKIGSFDANALYPEQVREFRDFVHSLSKDDLRARFAPERMAHLHIYPGQWDAEGEIESLLENFGHLKGFLQDVADRNDGCVIWIC